MTKRGFHSADAATVRECRELIGAVKTLHLATVDGSGEAEASYAPFVVTEGFQFFLFLSDLARHTQNLKEVGRASVLIIEPEETAANMFARRRAAFRCRCELIPRDDPLWPAPMTDFETKFGDIMELLRSLQDFNLYRLTAVEGSYVRGFGQAYSFSDSQLLA